MLREGVDYRDITQEVIVARSRLGISDIVSFYGRDYRVFPPGQVLVFDSPKIGAVYTIDHAKGIFHNSERDWILATGSTYRSHYRQMRERAEEFSPLVKRGGRMIDNLDEVWPHRPEIVSRHETYRAYTKRRVIEPLSIDEEQWVIPDGTAPNEEKAVREVERIERHLEEREVALAWLGIGSDERVIDGREVVASPHMAFVFPGETAHPEQGMMFVEMDEITRFVNSGGDPDTYFTHAMTMGPKDVLRAKSIVQTAWGSWKKQNMRRVLLEPVSSECPASLVFLQEGTKVIMDTESASLLLDEIKNL